MIHGKVGGGVPVGSYQKTLTALCEYFLLPGEPDARLNPKWLSRRLGIPERELLGALAYAVRDGLMEMRWEVYCPVCGLSPGEFGSRGRDVVVTDAVLADIEAEVLAGVPQPRVAQSFGAELRGIPAPVGVHRLVTSGADGASGRGSAPEKMSPSCCPTAV
jgi:hypothetical protein